MIGVRAQCFQRCHQFHTLICRMSFATRCTRFTCWKCCPRPATRAWVSRTCSVGVDNNHALDTY
jgi:hypothetical protein